MSVEVMAWVLRQSPSKGTERLVLLAIADHADRFGENAWPSVETIAKYANVSESAARRAIRRCSESGWLTVDIQGGPKVNTGANRGGKQRLNLYRVHMDEGVAQTPPPADPGGRADDPRGVAFDDSGGGVATPPNPSLDPSKDPSKGSTFVADAPDGFDAFWSAYPKARAKPAAKSAYRSALRHATHDRIMEGLADWARYWDERGPEVEQFIPYPQKWLNQHRWNDAPPAIARSRSRRDEQMDGIDALVGALPAGLFEGEPLVGIAGGPPPPGRLTGGSGS